MDLLITQGEISSVWQVEKDGRATRLGFPRYGDRDLCGSNGFLRSMNLPIEIVEKILVILFRHYLHTFNFDLCADLLLFSRSFTSYVYRGIFSNCGRGCTTRSFYKHYSRLFRIFCILENIYDEYIGNVGVIQYHCLKLTSMRSRGSHHQPWDFMHTPIVVPNVGLVVDLTDTQLQVRYGECYGETIWMSGNYIQTGVFRAQKIKTPVITLMFVDIFDTLIHNETGFNDHYKCFFKLLKNIFGKDTALFVMAKEDDLENPFITRSDLFLEF